MARKLIGMAGRVAGPQGSWRRRWGLLLSLLIALGAVMVVKQTVQAVHDLVFELDGNTAIDSNTDWASLFDANGAPLAFPAGFTGSGFKRDFALNANGSFSTADTSTYTTGSKDTLPIQGGWQCARSANVNSKTDIMNAYAAAYTDPATGDQIIYFAQERNNNTGDANVAFWFLQDAVGCTSTGGAVNFTGAHQDGDLLVVSAFTNGGTVSTITVYRWNGDDLTGSLGTTPVATGVDCRDPNLPSDTACAAANTAAITVPWLTATDRNVGNGLDRAQFFEGGLNLTEAGLSGNCFNTFVGNTRSSQSLTATIFDFASGTIGECTSTTTSTPSITVPTPIPANATLVVTDSATVTVTGVDSFTGQVNFFLCGPNASQTLCASGGVAAGTKPLSANGTVVSNAMTITQAGWYCWRADFSASDPAGIPPSSDSTAGECFLITPLTPTLATQAGAGPVDFGQPVTDVATLGGTAFHQGTGGLGDGSINPTVPPSPAGGTITFTLFKADCTTQATGTGTNPQVVAVSGDGVYGPVSFTPDAPGTYHWVASYGGDTPNTNPSSHNLLCNDPNESVVVRQIPTTIKTKQSWYPNDTATVEATTGNLAAGGKVVFSLYNNATCAGGTFYTEEKAITGGSPTQEVSTSNTTVPITTLYTDPANNTTVTFSWKVVYTPAAADTAHTGKQSACSAERFTITYTNDPGPGTDLP